MTISKCPWGHEPQLSRADGSCFVECVVHDDEACTVGRWCATEALAIEAWEKLVGPPKSPDDPRLWAMLPEWVQWITWDSFWHFQTWTGLEPQCHKTIREESCWTSDEPNGYDDLPLLLDHGDETAKIWRRP